MGFRNRSVQIFMLYETTAALISSRLWSSITTEDTKLKKKKQLDLLKRKTRFICVGKRVTQQLLRLKRKRAGQAIVWIYVSV